MDTLEESAAVALVAAAAGAVGQCPEGEWESRVQAKAFSLLRIVPKVMERAALDAETKPVPGILAGVEEVKGRGVVYSYATIGKPQRNQAVVNGRPVEQFRTAFLNTPEGQQMFDLASSLVGRLCRFGKRVESYKDANDQAAKVNMLEWIEDVGPAPEGRGPHNDTAGNVQVPTNAPAPRQSHDTPRSQPQTTTAPSGPEPFDFVANGWRDQAEHDKTRKEVVGALTTADDEVKQRFTAWASDRRYELRKPWPADQAMLIKAKLIAIMDEEEERQLVAAGGVPEYEPGTEPF